MLTILLNIATNYPQRLSAFTDEDALGRDDILGGSFIVRLQRKPLLKQKFELKLQGPDSIEQFWVLKQLEVEIPSCL